MEPESNKRQRNEDPNNVTQLVDKLTELNKEKGWRFELGLQLENAKEWEQNLPPKGFIMVVLSMDQNNQITLDCDTFMRCVNQEMADKKSLVNSKNQIYIKDENTRLWSIVYVETREKSRAPIVTDYVNCVDNKDPNPKCKLPQGIKELIWGCIEPKINDQMANATRDELRRFYLPERVIQELAPEEKDKEPPVCDFFKELKPKSVSNQDTVTCSDEMTKYLKDKLSTMRDQIVKTGKQKETDVFEKSMELAGNEMWELIKKTAEDFTTQPPFFTNGFIQANITMPEPENQEPEEHKEDIEVSPVVKPIEVQEEVQEEGKEEAKEEAKEETKEETKEEAKEEGKEEAKEKKPPNKIAKVVNASRFIRRASRSQKTRVSQDDLSITK